MAAIDTIADRSTGSAIAGKAYFETSTNKFIVFNGTAWIELDSDGVGAVYQNRWGASFDGSNDYLSLGDLSTLSSASSFSISMWVDLSNWSGNVIYVPFTSGTGNSDRVCFYLNSLNEVRFGVNASVGTCLFNLSTPVDYRNSGWHHLVGTYNGTNVTLFFDGTQVSTTTSSVPSTTSSTIGDGAAIGRETWSSSRYYNGKIDELAIFDSAQDQTAVTALYNGGVPAEVTGAVGYWRMGDDSSDSATAAGSISTITDSSGNGNDATQSTAANQPTFSALASSESIYA